MQKLTEEERKKKHREYIKKYRANKTYKEWHNRNKEKIKEKQKIL